MLLRVLDEASAKFRKDRRYHSPLHAVILVVDAWQALDADERLLAIVDYELDPRSLPLGMDVPGDYFYPAARTLVRLRVDMVKVEEMIGAAENPTQLRMLTWVLLERAGNMERATVALTNAGKKRHGTTEKQNIDKAMELLQHPSDLLPLPNRGGQSHSEAPGIIAEQRAETLETEATPKDTTDLAAAPQEVQAKPPSQGRTWTHLVIGLAAGLAIGAAGTWLLFRRRSGSRTG
jgi:hypothetical protein